MMNQLNNFLTVLGNYNFIIVSIMLALIAGKAFLPGWRNIPMCVVIILGSIVAALSYYGQTLSGSKFGLFGVACYIIIATLNAIEIMTLANKE